MHRFTEAKDRFWEKVAEDEAPHPQLGTPCWSWTGTVLRNLYGRIKIRGIGYGAHRVAWTLIYGDPGGSQVLHKCDNRRCCRPDHLFLGTHLDNMKDRDEKGRQAHGLRHGSKTKPERLCRGDRHWTKVRPPAGEANGHCILSESDVTQIREDLRAGGTCRGLAAKYHVSKSAIHNVSTGKRE